MQSFENFLRCYKNNEVVPTLEAFRKWLNFVTTKALIDVCKKIVGIHASQFYRSQCVKLCLEDFAQDMSLMQICEVESPEKTIFDVSKT